MAGKILLILGFSLSLVLSTSYAFTEDAIAHYKFEENLIDSTGNGNNGSINSGGDERYTIGQIEQAFDFKGSAYVILPNQSNFDFDITDPFSISLWFKGAADAKQGMLVSKKAGWTDSGYSVRIFDDGRIFFVLDGGNTYQIGSTTDVSDDTYHHIVVTYDGSSNSNGMKIYIDGTLEKTGPNSAITSGASNNLDVVIGAFNGGNLPLTGQIDDVQIYGFELTDAQVKGIFTKITFDQPIIVLEHSDNLTITDPFASSNDIIALVESNGESIDVNLSRIGTSDSFKSEFISFTDGPSDDGISQALHVSENSLIDVAYDGITYTSIATIENANSFLPTTYDWIQNFNMVAERGCKNPQGGDDDKDGVCDDWEQPPYIVDYPSQSTYELSCDPAADYNNNPLGENVCPVVGIKDIYIEIDYLEGHSPNIESLEKVVESFNLAPIEIQLHVILDEQILPHINEIDFPGDSASYGFDHIKAQEFGTDNERNNNWDDNKIAKAQVFYYYIWAHDQLNDVGSSGIAEEGGNDGGVTLGSFDGAVGNMDQQSGTFMHELGHNLGIDHGGSVDNEDNCKPNLLSVMSYSRQFSDLAPRSLDFSREQVGAFDNSPLGMENELDNQAGIGDYPEANSQIVFGDGNGGTVVEDTNQQTITWPSSSNWSDLRYIIDLDGREVCPRPTTAVQLDSVNQWDEIDLSLKSDHWREGRSLEQPTNQPSDPTDSSGISSFRETNTSIISTSYTSVIPSGDVKISINTGSSNPGCEVSNDCFSPSTVFTEAGTTVIWKNTDIATVHSVTNGYGGEFNNNYFTTGQTFSHKFENLGDFPYFCIFHPWMAGTISVVPDGEVPIPKGGYETHGNWCLSYEEALKQAEQKGLDLDRAPLCSSPDKNKENEINIENVRAARSVNVDNVLGIIKSLDNEDFVDSKSQKQLIQDLKNIRTLVLKDEMAKVLEGYLDLKISVNKKVTNERAQDELTTVIDRNIESTSNSVPEFGTLTILILVVSIISIIAISRKMPFNSINYK